jgi:hypothetical protein
MQTYKDFAPTPFDSSGAFLPDRADWFVAPVSRTRDTGPLTESNFETALDTLGGESDNVEVHRFGHWGPGWFEIVLIHPTAEKSKHVKYADIGDEIERGLENYPVLDESDFSERETEAVDDYWTYMSLAERVDFLRDNNSSIFAARCDYPSCDRISDTAYDTLRCWATE